MLRTPFGTLGVKKINSLGDQDLRYLRPPDLDGQLDWKGSQPRRRTRTVTSFASGGISADALPRSDMTPRQSILFVLASNTATILPGRPPRMRSSPTRVVKRTRIIRRRP